MIKNIGKSNSVLNHYIAEIRDQEIQKDSMRFRKNLERISIIFGYEISKTLIYEKKGVTTPLGTAEVEDLSETPILVPILRAGLPMHNGLLQIFDKADSAFVSAYRKSEKNEKFIIKVEYISSPDITDKTVIIADPMLATGASIVSTYKALIGFGKPKHTHIIVAIASAEGIEFVKKHLPAKSYTLWVGAIDEELTAQAYIVPGLGDAGDLAFGKK
ncbi:MAG: uracil phosphoribosyltransferase [Bacteroidales bacterium]|nr:uracil phosphoribosyltransferase [Bacteroidales bacterium]